MQALKFLAVRRAQLIRELKALGLFYAIFVLAVAVTMFCAFYQFQSSLQNVFVSGVLLTVLLLLIHFLRKDHMFILLVAKYPFQIYWAEYSIILLPFVLCSWFGFGQPFFIFLFVVAFFISWIPLQQLTLRRFNFTVKFIAEKNFEWQSGMRKNGWVVFVILIASAVLSFIPYLSLIILWFLLLITSTFYEQGESREMVEAYQMDVPGFIIAKIKSQLITYFILIIPVLLCSLFFFPENWWVLLFFMIFSAINIAVFVISKYAVWIPGLINRSGGILNTFCLAGFFLPFLLPLPIFVLIRNYRKCLINMKELLHDFR